MRKLRRSRAVSAGILTLVTAVAARGDATLTASKPHGVVSLMPVEIAATGFKDPSAITVDADGAILVTDRARGTLTRIRASGEREVLLEHLQQPGGVAVDRAGNILIVETAGRRILRLDRDGRTSVVASGLRQPRGIVIGPDGNIWIGMRRAEPQQDDDSGEAGDESEWVIARLERSGTPVVVASGLVSVQALASDASCIYAAIVRMAADRGRERTIVVRIPVQADGASAAPERTMSGLLRHRAGIAVDVAGDVFVSGTVSGVDTDGDAILKRHRDGQVTVLAEGVHNPGALAFAPNGDLLVVDGRHGGRILRLRAPPSPVLEARAFTKESPVQIAGRAGPGHRVQVFAAGVWSRHLATTIARMTDGLFSVETPVAANTTSTLSFVATSAAGLGLASTPASLRILHEDHLPRVAMIDPAGGAHVNALVALRVHAEDLESGIAAVGLMLDDVPLARMETDRPDEPFTASYTFDSRQFNEGPHTITAIAADRAGNQAAVAQLLTVDRTPPDTDIVAAPPAEIADGRARFTVAGRDEQSPAVSFAWRLDGGAWSPYGPESTVDLSGIGPGPHRFEARSRDLAGNEDATPAIHSFAVTSLLVRIIEPAADTVVHTNTVWVRGTVTSAGPVALTIALPEELRDMLSIDSLKALVIAGTFAVEVPVLPTTTVLAVTARDAQGATATSAVEIAVQGPLSEPSGLVIVFPPAGLTPHTVQFRVFNLPAGIYSLDLESDGIVEYTGETLEGRDFVYARPGMHVAHVRLTSPEGKVFEHRVSVWVYDRVALEKELLTVWNGFKEALLKNDAERAAMFIYSERRPSWLESLRKFTPEAFRALHDSLTDVTIESVHPGRIECEMPRVENGVTYSYRVRFVMDGDGEWRLSQL